MFPQNQQPQTAQEQALTGTVPWTEGATGAAAPGICFLAACASWPLGFRFSLLRSRSTKVPFILAMMSESTLAYWILWVWKRSSELPLPNAWPANFQASLDQNGRKGHVGRAAWECTGTWLTAIRSPFSGDPPAFPPFLQKPGTVATHHGLVIKWEPLHGA